MLKFKDKELEEARKEVATLKVSVFTKDKALFQSNQELRLLKERHMTTEGEVANMAKELAAVKVEKRKLEAQLAGLAKKGDKEQSMPALLAHRSSLISVASVEGLEQVASLQADLRNAKQEGEKAAESIRVLESLLRNKDRKIHSLQRKMEDVEVYRTKCADLENRVSDLLRQLDTEKNACRTSADVLRLSDSEIVKLTAELGKTRTALQSAQEAAARSNAALKVSESRCSALESEVSILAEQLARTSAVAHRVAVAEVKAGCKDEGVIHVTRHLEEVRFLSGEIMRLQERVNQLEKELAVSDELKDHYRRKSQPGTPKGYSQGGSSTPSSPAGSPTAFHSARTRPKSAGGNHEGSGGKRTPRSAGRTGSAAASGGTIRTSFSTSSRKLPWGFNPKSPAKMVEAEMDGASGGRGGSRRPVSAGNTGSAAKGAKRKEAVAEASAEVAVALKESVSQAAESAGRARSRSPGRSSSTGRHSRSAGSRSPDSRSGCL
ncbi:hypothetical protein VOLCADRAFT_86810 [Volvox carteri f. nagariensis]|uniref:Uncharacterized protein n=1 Tax=Volvox carteri f. nagariensis TaxID=3068 RepID=D8TJN6_VOLCA|nr:uncharacterized protein VOLCADRAFT_86810 [Volvox carteri f. nagariensis]EFJ52404.1 hypothetical protein VOLCADRAFT_86810 [Volvox carteri f. nagariensis]|eukprot:XP_002946477.1 hypothetical protein VOLCADRAFT_86810 [Volvox carteri f. nagariensis]